MDDESPALGVLTGDADDDVSAALLALEQLGLEADLLQLTDDVLGRLALPRPLDPGAVVARVDANEVTADTKDVAFGGCRSHAPTLPPVSGHEKAAR